MLDKICEQLSSLKVDCDYWDVRVEDSFETSITIVDGEVSTCSVSPSLGAFLRVKKNGFWLYESTTEVHQLRNTLEKLAEQKAPKGRATQAQYPPKNDSFIKIKYSETKFSSVPLEAKLALVKSYLGVSSGEPLMSSNQLVYKDIYKVKSFLSSTGNTFEFDFNQGGIAFLYTLKDKEKLFDDRFYIYGADFLSLQNKHEKMKKSIKESQVFLNAPIIEPGKYKVLLDPWTAGVFTHESFGHKSEADFMLGDPQALEDWKIGKKIGSSCLSIVDFGGFENTSGYCPIDDDGSLAQKNYLIKNGVLTGRLHTIETASELKERPTGNSRAMSFEYEPLVRMTSTYIEPGTESLESIMNRSEGAILIEGNKHGSGLSTFTIAPIRGYRIGKNGSKDPVRLALISGSVFETLGKIEAVTSDYLLGSSAIGGCGKFEQWPLPVSFGGPYVLVQDMQVS